MTALAFSNDGSMIAVAQSDKIVFVYKIGADWDEKKSIVAKLVQNSSITCMKWLPDGQLIFGLADGKVIILNSNSSPIDNATLDIKIDFFVSTLSRSARET